MEAMRILDEGAKALNVIDEDNRTRDAWTARTRWDDFMANKDAEECRKYARTPGKDEFPGLRKGLLHFLKSTDSKLESLSLLLKKKLHTEDPSQG